MGTRTWLFWIVQDIYPLIILGLSEGFDMVSDATRRQADGGSAHVVLTTGASCMGVFSHGMLVFGSGLANHY